MFFTELLHPVLLCTNLLHPVFCNVSRVDSVYKKYHIGLMGNCYSFLFYLKQNIAGKQNSKYLTNLLSRSVNFFIFEYPFSAFLCCSTRVFLLMCKSHKFLERKSEDPKSPIS